MLDNLYLDQLKGRITETKYDRFYQSLKDQSQDLEIRLEQLKKEEDSYHITSRCVLSLVNHAHELFLKLKKEGNLSSLYYRT